MVKRCEKIGCKKVAKHIYEGKQVCKFHRCRCNIEEDKDSNFYQCLIHKKKSK